MKDKVPDWHRGNQESILISEQRKMQFLLCVRDLLPSKAAVTQNVNVRYCDNPLN